MGRYINIPLAYAIQNNTETKTSGVARYGYPKTDEYVDRGKSQHQSLKLFFEIPEDLYKHVYGKVKGSSTSRYGNIVFPENCINFSKEIFYVTTEYIYESGKIETEKKISEAESDRVLATREDSDFYAQPGFSFGGVATNPYFNDEIPESAKAHYFEIKNEYATSIQFFDSKYFVVNYEGQYPVVPTTTEREYTGYKIKDTYYTNTYVEFSNIEDIYISLFIEDIDIYVQPNYPLDVYVRKDRNSVITWDVFNSANRSSDYLYPVESIITINDSYGHTANFTITGTDKYKDISVSDWNALSVGKCTGTIQVNTNYDRIGIAEFAFDLIGQSDAPDIISVTQNSYPTISWNCDNQISWELIIKQDNKIVYQTGMKAGSDKEYTLPKLLNNGNYSIEMRALNNYGIYTGWSSYSLILNPPAPESPNNVIVSANTKFGITVECEPIETEGKLLVVRRKSGEAEEVIGEYTKDFLDCWVSLNEPYEYTIRHYLQGYADGDWIDGIVKANGVVIRDSNDYLNFVHVWMSDESDDTYRITEERSDALVQCVGRTYPVAEFGEWLTSIRTFSGYVSEEDFIKLLKIKDEGLSVLIQSDKEVMPCYMELSDAGKHVKGGRMIDFKMTRIDGERK